MTEDIEIPLASTDKYENALAKARFEYEKNPCASESEKRLLEIIFPELAESEDERIRRFLVELVSNDKLIDFGGLYKVRNVLYDDVLTYLEKQKGVEAEIEKAYKNADKIQYEKGFEDGVASVKPAEWSEEDERILKGIIGLIDHDQHYDVSNNEMLAWLKSLRPQPNRNLAISFMNYLDKHRPDGKMCLSNGECADIEKAFKEEDWAKVIRYVNKYQPHWKPSEIDMKYLDLAIVLAEADKSYNLADGLKRLRDELKKL